MAAVLDHARQHPQVRPADFRLLMELAARTDPDTGAARVSLRTLATAVHHKDLKAIRRLLRGFETAGWLERLGTGRQGLAIERNTETYRLTVGSMPTVSGVVTVGSQPPVTVGSQPPVIDKKRRPLTEVQRLAMQAARLDLRNGTHTPGGHSDDDAHWTAGEAALWDAAQAMEAELFELADYRDPARFAQ
jgi:hypothetical protein